MSELVSETFIYTAIGLLCLCSVITRSGFLLFGDHIPLPDSVRHALRFAPMAALIAIIMPELMPWKTGLGLVFDYKLVAAIFAMFIYVRTRSAVMVIFTGMLTFWSLRWLLGAG